MNGVGNGDVIRWGSAADNLRIGFGWGSYGSIAAIYSVYGMNLDSGARTNITASGTDSNDKVYLNSNNGVDIRTNAVVTGILTASNVSTAGSVTAATLFGDGSNLSGVGGGSTAFVDTASLTVAGISTFSGDIKTNGNIIGDNSTNITGISSVTTTKFYGDGSSIVTSQWAVANSGSSHYTFTGPGNLSAAEDPTLYLARGQTYDFAVNVSGHPFRIQSPAGAFYAGTQYETGVTNPGAAVGTIKFQIPFDAPNTLYYVCQNHSAMNGTLTIYPSI